MGSLDDNGWQEWKMHVLSELRRLNSQCENRCVMAEGKYMELWKKIESIEREMLERFSSLNSELSALRVKSGLWGAAGAGLVLIIPAVIKYLL